MLVLIGGVPIFKTGCCVYVVYLGLQACSGGHEEGVGGEEGSVGLGSGCSTGEGSRGGQLRDTCMLLCGAVCVW
jgi:hypothetical protein